jgi:PiT family inorganic phosphate transporter
MGVGATKRFSAVRWGVARQVVAAWVLTWPTCLILGFALGKLLPLLVGD